AASPDSTKDPDSTRADMGAYYYHQSLSNFSLSNPVNNNLITTVQPIFNWNSSVPSGEEPIKYNLYFSKSMSFADSLTTVVQNITNDNYALPDPLDDYTEYYWKVLAKNPWSLEKWSNETWKFSVNTDTLAPEISDLPVISFNEDDSVTVLNSTWYPYVHDVATDDSLLIYEITPGKNVAVTQIDKGYLLKAKVNWFGLDTLQLKVTDFGNLNSKSPLIVDVKSVNDLPEFIGLPDSLSFFGDTTFSFIIWDYVNDIETSDSLLIYSFQAETDSLLINFESTTGTVELSSSGFIGTTKLFLTATDDSLASVSDTIFVTVKKSITSIADINDLIPNEYILFQNYPNPFNPTTTLTFGLPEPSFVKIEIFNMLGQKVLSLYEGEKSAGYHKIVWNAQAYSSGIYIYRLIAKGNKNITLIKRMILLK
ncbi:T9SS type A sorting domain-containing protein, partial [bacterium BMS3Abin03]|nr:T9SS type A sorting domain-containing protein [bacterium BMS3Abin03]